MSDFLTLAQTVGVPLAMTLVAVGCLSRALVAVSRDKDRVGQSRYDDMKLQFEARLAEQREQFQKQINDIEEDRDWNRDRLHQAMGLTDAGTATVEEVVRRIARKQLPPSK